MKKNIPRLYQHVDLAVDSTITLSDTAFRHAIKSLRLRENDAVILFNGLGGEYQATLTTVTRQHAEVRIDEFDPVSRESGVLIHLGQCLSRPERMDYAIQKSVEVGVAEITPIFAERCQYRLPADRIEKRMMHWQQVIVSACEQSGRTRLPTLHAPQSLSEWVANRAGMSFVCDGSAAISGDLTLLSKMVSCLVGPEGGLTDDELRLCYLNDFNGFSLGDRVLRTETAPIVAITLLQNLPSRI